MSSLLSDMDSLAAAGAEVQFLHSVPTGAQRAHVAPLSFRSSCLSPGEKKGGICRNGPPSSSKIESQVRSSDQAVSTSVLVVLKRHSSREDVLSIRRKAIRF